MCLLAILEVLLATPSNSIHSDALLVIFGHDVLPRCPVENSRREAA